MTAVDPEERWPDLRPIGAERRLGDYVRDLWDRREFAYTLPLGQLRAQNQDSALGQVWHLLNPLLLVVVYWLVFDVFLGRGGSGRSSWSGTDNYLGFLVAGIIPYTYTAKSMQAGARVIVANRTLVQTINFPRAVLPVSALLTEAMSQLPALAVMLALLVATGEHPSVWWLLILPAFVLQTVFNAGLACYTARMTFHFQDVQQVLPYVLRIVFYLSGIIFAVERVRESHPLIYRVLLVNPINAFVRIYRETVLTGPSEASAWDIAVGWTVVVALSGFLYFRAAEGEYGQV